MMQPVSLNFTTQGEKSQHLIIMHGLFGSGRNWQGIAKQLSEHFTVHTLDMRNHGSSPHHDAMSYPEMAADVLEFMDEKGIGEAYILGHSMGGKVAMTFALAHSERVSKLVVVDIAPVIYQHEFNDILSALHSIPLETVTSRKEADAILAEKIDVLSLRQFLLQNLVPVKTGGFEWRVNLKSIEHNMNNIMGFPDAHASKSYHVPSLFIGGGGSTYLAPRFQEAVKACFPNAEIYIIPKVGHWPHIESPAAFLDSLNPFLLN
jgi:esterase